MDTRSTSRGNRHRRGAPLAAAAVVAAVALALVALPRGSLAWLYVLALFLLIGGAAFFSTRWG